MRLSQKQDARPGSSLRARSRARKVVKRSCACGGVRLWHLRRSFQKIEISRCSGDRTSVMYATGGRSACAISGRVASSNEACRACRVRRCETSTCCTSRVQTPPTLSPRQGSCVRAGLVPQHFGVKKGSGFEDLGGHAFSGGLSLTMQVYPCCSCRVAPLCMTAAKPTGKWCWFRWRGCSGSMRSARWPHARWSTSDSVVLPVRGTLICATLR